MELAAFLVLGAVVSAVGRRLMKTRAMLLAVPLCVLPYLTGQRGTEALFSALMACLLLAAALADLERLIIPNLLVCALALLAPAEWLAGGIGMPDRLAGALAAGGLALLIRVAGSRAMRTTALGWGDVKLAAAWGLMLGWRAALIALVAASVLALPCAAVLRKCDRLPESGVVPFAPALAAGAMIGRLFGDALLGLLLPGL